MANADELGLSKVNVASAYEQVFRELEGRILDGRLRAGDQLPTEMDLAERFEVNRSTVREGIRRLESEGLVQRLGRRRLVVTLPRHSDLTPRTSRALVMHQVTFRELWHVALAMEPLAARLAAFHATPKDLEALSANLEATAQVIDRGESPAALDTEFQSLVAEAARNRALSLSREPIGLLLRPALEALIPLLPQAGPRLLEAHREVYDAIRVGDGERAFEWMYKHVIDFQRGYELAQLPLDEPVSMPDAECDARAPQRDPDVVSASLQVHGGGRTCG
ncbi:FadR/GntR family transcriptional regulator [Aquisalimonas lutea]|uniref:FadR/GntR family transcriptional regulator n=1 Tax=Aquisalimonas lutea TaxID=1327750 RepID=UPI0025B61D27|nr:FadR/GntR family transcriptional regulator [Aquisalimonas lutea]MDN3517228.1 FadR/GntR family transcriptional regulator [Aquisalimonas lutea]